MSIPEDKMEKLRYEVNQFVEEAIKTAEKYFGPYGEKYETLKETMRDTLLKELVNFYQQNPEKIKEL